MNNIKDFEINDGILIKYNGVDANVVIPDGVTEIKYEAFRDCESLTSITISEGVTEIGMCAFKNCNNLETIIFPDSLQKVDYGVFEGCSSIKEVHANSLGSWCNIDFHPYKSSPLDYDTKLLIADEELSEIVIPENVNSIGCGAFKNIESITKVIMHDGVKKVGSGAFLGCKNLRSVSFSEGLEWIDSSAFSGCEKLESITIPSTITHIDSWTFSGCCSLEKVFIPQGVESLGMQAFSGCYQLKMIEIPGSVSEIQDETFSFCRELENVTISEGVTSIARGAFEGCRELYSVIIPASVQEIGESAFEKKTLLILDYYIEGIEKKVKSERIVIKKTPIQDIKSNNAKASAIKGFLTADDIAIFDDVVVDSYKKYLKGKLMKYEDFIVLNDPAAMIEKIATLGLLDEKLVNSVLEHDLPEETKLLITEKANTVL